MFLNFDYKELAQELVRDLNEFGIKSDDDTIYIVRANKEIYGYRPIIDYYLRKEHIKEDDIDNVEKKTVIDVINEIKKMDEDIN